MATDGTIDCFAKLNNVPTSPRKMRLVVDNIRGMEGELYISRVFVDGGATLKRLRPAPQGRGYRIRKRSNHVTLYVSSLNNANNQKQDGTED